MNNDQGSDRLKRIKYYHLLIRKFNHGDLPDRINAARDLANFPNKTTSNALYSPQMMVRFLNHPDENVVIKILRSIAENGDESLESLILGICESPIPSISHEAKLCIEKLRDKKRFIKF